MSLFNKCFDFWIMFHLHNLEWCWTLTTFCIILLLQYLCAIVIVIHHKLDVFFIFMFPGAFEKHSGRIVVCINIWRSLEATQVLTDIPLALADSSSWVHFHVGYEFGGELFLCHGGRGKENAYTLLICINDFYSWEDVHLQCRVEFSLVKLFLYWYVRKSLIFPHPFFLSLSISSALMRRVIIQIAYFIVIFLSKLVFCGYLFATLSDDEEKIFWHEWKVLNNNFDIARKRDVF